MGLLDGVLKSIVGSAFSPILLDGSIVKQAAKTDDGRGGYSVGSPTFIPVKLLVEEYQARVDGQTETGVGRRDVTITILQQGVDGMPTLEDSILAPDPARGNAMTIFRVTGPIKSDPAGATWTCGGVR